MNVWTLLEMLRGVSGRFCGGCPAIAGAASPVDLAKAVGVDVTSLTDGGMVTVGVAVLADAGREFPADPAGVVTIGVASLADAGMVTVGVTDLAVAVVAPLADAGMVFPADPAGMVTVGVPDLAVAGAAPLADAGIVFPADPAGMATVGVPYLTDVTPVNVIGVPEWGSAVSWGDRLSSGVWCREKTLIRKNFEVRLDN